MLRVQQAVAPEFIARTFAGDTFVALAVLWATPIPSKLGLVDATHRRAARGTRGLRPRVALIPRRTQT